MQLTVYIPRLTPRVAYAFSLLFERVVQLPYRLTDQQEGAQLAYSPRPQTGISFWLPASGLLSASNIRPQPIEQFEHDGLPAFFGCPDAGEALLPFDLPALAFYLASRYEEYLPAEKDAHGRFPGKASLAYRSGFLHQPLVNQWGIKLAQQLQVLWPGLNVIYPTYQFRPSYDIDLAWAYRERPLWLQGAGAARDALRGEWARLRQRWQVARGRAQDPFDTFAYLEKWHSQLHLAPLYFFLLGDYKTYDKNIDPNRARFQERLRGLAQKHDTGLHPSYASNGRPKQLAKEYNRYRKITGQPPKRSRQHYLKLELPATYRALLEQGITADYSMGFADEVGFRASMARPFPWYDLEREQATPLTLYPFALMDGSLHHYLQLPPEQATAIIRQLVDEVRSVGGLFIPLWHNSSFSAAHGWAGWQAVFERMLAHASTDYP
ncbi:MAG: hypothetical protein GVY26_14780 [Bacteroidetes bacterium]|nr:hypothetical protein [Bacteroidota bacterium]